MLKRIAHELLEHAPFTAAGAVTGIIIMVIIQITSTPKETSSALFYTLHPLHIVFSALVTTAMYRLSRRGKLWANVIIGYIGSVGIATISDAIIPYLEASAIHIHMEFHLPFLETTPIPYIGIPEWIAVNAASVIGIAIGYLKPTTKFPHMGHILISTWASLFSFTAFSLSITNWMPLLPFIFLFLFLAVWIPCCFSDIVFPLLWIREKQPFASEKDPGCT